MRLFSLLLSAPTSWKKYLIEWRGIESSLRINEFVDAAQVVLYDRNNNNLNDYNINFNQVIEDTLSNNPIAVYCKLPADEEAIKTIVKRCSTVRTISEVWTDIEIKNNYQNNQDIEIGENICNNCIDDNKYHEILQSFNSYNNAWRTDFRRYGRGGRSGMTYDEKSTFLKQLDPLFYKLNDSLPNFKVDLQNYYHKLFYLEDWSNYHNQLELLKAQERIKNGCNDDTLIDLDILSQSIQPSRAIFGRIIAEGENYEKLYSVKNRPFIGTTSMDAITSQISANAARIKKDQKGLDPFAGTGSLPLAAALLDAQVTLSDIDSEGLGISTIGTNVEAGEIPKKNSAFKRKEGIEFESNSGGPIENFKYYNVENNVKNILVKDVRDWLYDEESFDFIVTDPPFGRRERAAGSASSSPSLNNAMGEPDIAVEFMLQVAEKRLNNEGTIAFWMPTESSTTLDTLKEKLKVLEKRAGIESSSLKFKRATRQELHSGLSRWLCVYSKSNIKWTYSITKDT